MCVILLLQQVTRCARYGPVFITNSNVFCVLLLSRKGYGIWKLQSMPIDVSGFFVNLPRSNLTAIKCCFALLNIQQ